MRERREAVSKSAYSTRGAGVRATERGRGGRGEREGREGGRREGNRGRG